jgi:hypothetical protein
MTHKGAYRYALATIGVPPNSKKIIFIKEKPSMIPNDSVIIDWNKYALARRNHLEYLRHNDYQLKH